ncbi:MAG: GNAT family N-acetyltransferase [Bacteroidota bacterium]
MKFRKATKKDVPYIVKMLADDPLGKEREVYQDPLPKRYYDAFYAIDNDNNQELIVIEDEAEAIIGTLQLSFIPYLTYQGGIRAQLEAVRISADKREKGIGALALQWAMRRAKERGAHLLQLTTDKKRLEALKFYEKLGFLASHEGMKLHFKAENR